MSKLKTGKLLVSRGVDHRFISGGWRRLDVADPFAAQDVARIMNAVVGEIFCLRGPWSWKTCDELAYVRRVLREIGVRNVEKRVVGREAGEIVFECGDRTVVVTDAPQKASGESFALYTMHPWGISMTSLERRERVRAARHEFARSEGWELPGE